jgi:predicted nucleic acid-binding protein
MIVSDASLLINLARIGELDLLWKLYGEITVPEAVWQEVVVNGAGQPGAEDIKTADWVKRALVKNRYLVQALRQDLDAGEAEAIALALEIEAELLLMDERLGRESAHHFGLRYIGLIGVLSEAKHRGLISTVKPYLDALRDIAGFRLAMPLYERVLRDQGEL